MRVFLIKSWPDAMGVDESISGGCHGCRWESAPGQVGWLKLPVPERDMVTKRCVQEASGDGAVELQCTVGGSIWYWGAALGSGSSSDFDFMAGVSSLAGRFRLIRTLINSPLPLPEKEIRTYSYT